MRNTVPRIIVNIGNLHDESTCDLGGLSHSIGAHNPGSSAGAVIVNTT